MVEYIIPCYYYSRRYMLLVNYKVYKLTEITQIGKLTPPSLEGLLLPTQARWPRYQFLFRLELAGSRHSSPHRLPPSPPSFIKRFHMGFICFIAAVIQGNLCCSLA